MDWLLFDSAPMYLQEKQTNKVLVKEEKRLRELEELMVEVRELVEHMEQDPVLRHEILLHFYNYKNKMKTRENKEPDYERPLLKVSPEDRERVFERLNFLYGDVVARAYMPELERILDVDFRFDQVARIIVCLRFFEIAGSLLFGRLACGDNQGC